MSDTGGGHRACTQAVSESLTKLYPSQVSFNIVDGLKDHSPVPFKYAAPLYPWLTKSKRFWQANYIGTNSRSKTQTLVNALWPYLRPKTLNLLRNHQADLIVSLHPLLTHTIIKGLAELRLTTPFAIIVTDPVSPHAAWFPQGAAHYFVSTPQARRIALASSLPPSSISVIGHPISLVFRPSVSLSNQPPTILVMGGGLGLGKLYSTIIALCQITLPFKLVVIAGRNHQLYTKLTRRAWPVPVQILGFTPNVPSLMREACIFVTKAGPSSLYEGLACHLPIIIYDYLPGQEDGNLELGTYCPTPASLITTITDWLTHPQKLATFALRSSQLAKPTAALDLARHLYKLS